MRIVVLLLIKVKHFFAVYFFFCVFLQKMALVLKIHGKGLKIFKKNAQFTVENSNFCKMRFL